MSQALTTSSHTPARARLHGVELEVQGQHAGRAQHQLAAAQRGADERHAGPLALGEHVAVAVDDHPGAVEVEAGVDELGAVQRQRATGLDGVDGQGREAGVLGR
jgi:hypothetical protein